MWKRGLQQCGVYMYYNGWVEDVESLLSIHGRDTVTCYGTRRSSKASGCSSSPVDKENKESSMKKVNKQKYRLTNCPFSTLFVWTLYICTQLLQACTLPKLFWRKGEMEYNRTPFCIVETKQMDCQFGPHYYKEREQKTGRIRVQGTRKLGRHASISIKNAQYTQSIQFMALN